MKKFLSLVLAMIMALSLVTISAGAVEYEDISDLDEITYQEAVAVLNKIGVITGYEDGSFRPEANLTRQAAAKIIVSLLIGPEAANNLTVATAPYPDVPASSQFAAYISFCKNENIISGYSDGTFKPEGTLTGYAFSKMLLGAIGYRGDIEGFTGSGWTMRVASIGNAANLFDRLTFQGGDPVNREVACQLALNTLKATMVEYTGGFNVTAGDAVVTGAMTRNYITSNQEYAKNISNRKLNQAGNNIGAGEHYTVEFGEEHFKDLVMINEHQGKLDSFGRPSNVWSWKKVTIGTFPIEPDFVYIEQVAALDDNKVTDASKIRALGLNGYEVTASTELYINGYEMTGFFNNNNNLADIANFTDNGTVVEVYVSEDAADWICNVVVVHTQLMEVKKVAAESVSLKLYDDDGASTQKVGFNNKDYTYTDGGKWDPESNPYPYVRLDFDVNDVEVNDDCFEFLSGLKAGDYVAVVPLSDGDDWTVAAAYTPETVTGALTGSETFANSTKADEERTVTTVTVGGTTYKVATWNKNLNDINRNKLKVTTKDVTLYLDEFGNAMLAKNVGATSDYMILGSWKNAVVNNVIVLLAEGWDISGNPVSLNLGSNVSGPAVNAKNNFVPGDVAHYTNQGAAGDAEWVLNRVGVYGVPGNDSAANKDTLVIKANNSTIKLTPQQPTGDVITAKFNNQPQKASSIKTIYVSFDPATGDVDYIEVKTGLQNITNNELNDSNPYYKARPNPKAGQMAEATMHLSNNAIPDKSDVTALVIKRDSSDASLKNLGYIYDVKSTNQRDDDNNIISTYKMFTRDDEAVSISSASNGVDNRMFVRYTELDNDLYRLRAYNRTQVGTSTMTAKIIATAASSTGNVQRNNNMYLLEANNFTVVGSSNQKYNGYNDGSTTYLVPNIADKGYINVGGVVDGVDLTKGDSYNNMISVQGAKFLDLVNRKSADAIDSASDLRDAIDKGKKVTVDLCFNDNPDSDDFRLAYIVVVTGIEDGVKGPQSNGAVAFSNGKLSNTKLAVGKGSEMFGEITKDSLWTDPSTDKVYASFELAVPNWAAPKQNDGNMKIAYQMYVDYGDGYVAWGTGKSIATTALTNADAAVTANSTSQGQITKFTVKNFEVIDPTASAALMQRIEDAKGIYMEITAIDYGFARVEYKVGDTDTDLKTVASGSVEFLSTTTAANGNLWCASTNDLYVSTAYGGSINAVTVENAKQGGVYVTKSSTAYTDNTANNPGFIADGNDWVVVRAYGLTDNAKWNLTTKVYDGANGLIDASGKNTDLSQIVSSGASNLTSHNAVKVYVTATPSLLADGAVTGASGQANNSLVKGHDYTLSLIFNGGTGASGSAAMTFKIWVGTNPNTADPTYKINKVVDLTTVDAETGSGPLGAADTILVAEQKITATGDVYVEVDAIGVPAIAKTGTPEFTPDKADAPEQGGTLVFDVNTLLDVPENGIPSSGWFTKTGTVVIEEIVSVVNHPDDPDDDTCLTGTATITLKVSAVGAGDTIVLSSIARAKSGVYSAASASQTLTAAVTPGTSVSFS